MKHTLSVTYDLLTRYIPTRNLRSVNSGLLRIPKAKLRSMDDGACCCYAPGLWNNLPQVIKDANTAEAFKKQLKMHLYVQAFHHG